MALKSRLIICGTSIGHEADIPARSLSAIRDADLAVFESHRAARGFLKCAGIHREYLQLSEHGESETIDAIRTAFKSNKTVSLMSDQGMPVFADPGRGILEMAYQLGVKIEVIPGPSSVTSALAACPFNIERFYFIGFLPQKTEERVRELAKQSQSNAALVLMDTPYRLRQTIEDVGQAIPGRKIFLALNIGMENENYLVGTPDKLLQKIPEKSKEFNFVIIVEGKS